jgi:hypothetical protein
MADFRGCGGWKRRGAGEFIGYVGAALVERLELVNFECVNGRSRWQGRVIPIALREGDLDISVLVYSIVPDDPLWLSRDSALPNYPTRRVS